MKHFSVVLFTVIWFLLISDDVKGHDLFDFETWDEASLERETRSMDYDYTAVDTSWAVGILFLFFGLPCIGCCVVIGIIALIVFCIVKASSQPSSRGVVYQQAPSVPVIQAQQTLVVPPTQAESQQQPPPLYQGHFNQGFQTYPAQPMPPSLVPSQAPPPYAPNPTQPREGAPNVQPGSGNPNKTPSGGTSGVQAATRGESYVDPANVYDEYRITSYTECQLSATNDGKVNEN